MKFKKIKATSLILLSFFANIISAQSVEEITAKYPNALATFQNISREVKITNKENGLNIETTDESEILLLSEKASGIYNKGRVYHGSFDEVKQIEAYTKVNDAGKFKKIKVTEFKTENAQSNSIFYDDGKETVFDFPSTTKGSICYQKSVIAEKDIHLLTPFYFNNYLPIQNINLNIEFPSNVALKYIVKNDPNHTISIKEALEGRTKKLSFKAVDLKERNYFNNAPAVSATEPHVIFYITSYTNNNNEKVTVFETIDDFYKWNFSHLKSVNKEPSKELQTITENIIKTAKTEEDKAKSIFKWVQSNIKYVAFEDGLEGFVPRNAKDVCFKKYGDCKDMASLLTVMLNLANIKAYYTWIGTRSIEYDYNEVHLPITDNHMICAARINEKWFFLDATDPNCIFGLPTYSIQTKQALIAVDDNNYFIERVPTVDYSQNQVVDTTKITITPASIKGSTTVHFSGYCGSDTYNYLEHKDEVQTKDYVKARLIKGNNKFIMGDFGVNKYDVENKKISMFANFEIPGYAKQVGDEYYINLNLDKFQVNTFIDTAKRKIDVAYDYKQSWRLYTILTIPDGYDVDYLPKNYSTNLSDFSMNISYEKKGNQIIFFQQFISNTLLFKADKFFEWNKTVKELNSQYKEQVVLKRLNK